VVYARALATLASAILVSVQASQIVCFVPFTLDGATSANVQVTYLGAVSNLYML
jgi:hypothetical protein